MSTGLLMQDQAYVPANTDEELAGPPHRTVPVQRQERISSIDALRGFALLGILLMNIPGFAYPGILPVQMVHPIFSGPHHHLNTAIYVGRWMLAEGRMRGLFSLLFGAGALLLIDRATARGAGLRVADIFMRRNLWLALFGLLHCYLIWNGDILFYYGVTSVLFLFPLRNLRPKTLVIAAAVLFVLNSTVGNEAIFHPFQVLREHHTAQHAYTDRAAHHSLSAAEQEAINTWEARLAKKPTMDMTYKAIAAHQKGYVATRIADAPESYHMQTAWQAPGWGDWGTMMLLGMALYRYGFLTLQWSRKAYALTAAVGLGISLPLAAWFTWNVIRSGSDPYSRAWADIYYDTARVSGTLGNAALLLLMMKSGWLKRLFRLLANVGQTALSNYILTSLVMQTLFVWSPLHWVGYLEYYKAYLVVLGMWAVNLTLSHFWLKRFLFGPLEWLWRSLTYWRRQPMRLTAPA